MAIVSYGYWASSGWGTESFMAASFEDEIKHPFYTEEKREAPEPPPPARLFVSVEGRYAIQQGWLAGADYVENKIATHGEAVAMIMQIAALDWDTVSFYGILIDNENFDPEQPLTRRDFLLYLNYVFHNLPDEGILEPDADGGFDPEKEMTLAEMAKAAYRLRGLNPHGD